MPVDTNRLRAAISPSAPPFSLNKIGHVVLMVENLERSIAFYTGVLGFKVSDIIGEDRMPGGMIFMRCNPDHHGIALVGGASGPAHQQELHHILGVDLMPQRPMVVGLLVAVNLVIIKPPVLSCSGSVREQLIILMH